MRRRRDSSESGDYDSVLDTMTNVVGILIIVVAVTQLNVSSAVGRARDALIESGEFHDHPPVAEDVLTAARREHEQLRARAEALEGDRGSSPAGGEEGVSVSEEEWAALTDRLRATALAPTAEDIKAKIRAAREELRLLEAESLRIQETIKLSMERSRLLKAELEALAKRKLETAPPMRIRLPDPRGGRSAGKKVIQIVAKGGKLYELDISALLDKMVTDVNRESSRMPDRIGASTLEAQLRWLCRRLQSRTYANDVWRLSFRVLPDERSRGGWNIQVGRELVGRPRSTTLEDLASKQSAFAELLSGLDSTQFWFYFLVFDDSFEIYLSARSAVEDAGFVAGWAPYGREERLYNLLLRRPNSSSSFGGPKDD
jgi:hypothetical protein